MSLPVSGSEGTETTVVFRRRVIVNVNGGTVSSDTLAMLFGLHVGVSVNEEALLHQLISFVQCDKAPAGHYSTAGAENMHRYFGSLHKYLSTQM